MNPTQWEKIFQNDPHFHLEPHPRAVQFTDQLLDRRLSSVLDLGCGGGRHVVHMARQGLHVTGMDNAPTALKMTRQWLEEDHFDATLVLADMRQPLPFADGAFDAVLSSDVIHHALLDTVMGTAREIARVVRPAGMILLSVPLRRDHLKGSPEFDEIEPNTFVPTDGMEKGLPHHLFTPDEFQAIFPGFQVMELEVVDERVIVLQALKK